ncbi:2,5-diketo-D-gluconate reductase A [Solimonas aquatica]|uniref:2,5-diketo-D-gluconate reductase A n=1 Tax=Solimonas aquatica TaxID=489703 RepID=A0A1H9KCY2_9GAMM|nr:aldo/keto reductase [Solimonas aquatica]SEQ96942.1 2,5-diketo-D-gluconate reductase A [Solimonas aquatica]
MSSTDRLAATVDLGGGVRMPQLGLGTWPMNDAEAARAIAQAIGLGYRLIDTAENYQNETGVGQGIKASGIAREQVFVTSKFNRRWHSLAGVREACEHSLRRLGLDYLDLFLIHWPNPDQDRYVEAFEGLVKLREAGLVRAIGTSNFKPAHLQRLFAVGLQPQLNQIQLDPYHRRDDLVAIHRAHGIVTESWRPLGCGSDMLSDPVVAGIARTHARTAAQVLLRWQVQQGFVTCPKSSDALRQAQNLSVFDFVLSAAEMAALDALDRPDPQMFDADHFGH